MGKIGRPSPAMIVAIIALVMATTGSAVAAVTYARNAGAVDGRSAVGAGSSVSRAAGKLVATARSGAGRGRIPAKFLALPPASSPTAGFARAVPVADNATSAAVTLVDLGGFGALTLSCADENAKAGTADPSSKVTFTNSSAEPLGLARSIGNGAPGVSGLAPGTVTSFTVKGSSTFELELQRGAEVVLIRGALRQDVPGPLGGSCLAFGLTVRGG